MPQPSISRRHWYDEERTRLQSAIKRATLMGKLVMVWLCVLCSVIVVGFTFVRKPSFGDDAPVFTVVSIVLIVLHLAIVICIVIYARIQLNKFTNVPRDRSISCDPSKLPTVVSLVQSLCQQIGINPSQIRYWTSRSDSCSFSILEADGNYQLMISVGALVKTSQSPELARAMLAHELAHIVHGDSLLWPIASVFATSIIKVLWPVVLIHGTFYLLSGAIVYGWPWNWEGSVPFLLVNTRGIIMVCENILAVRRQSEILADAFAGLHTDVTTIHTAIQYYIKDDKYTDTYNRFNLDTDVTDINDITDISKGMHPPRELRLRKLQAFAKMPE